MANVTGLMMVIMTALGALVNTSDVKLNNTTSLIVAFDNTTSQVTISGLGMENMTTDGNFSMDALRTTLKPTTKKKIVKEPRPYSRKWWAIAEADPVYRAAVYIRTYKYIFISPIGIIGNGLAILVLAKRAKKYSSYVYMAAIAMADMFYITCITGFIIMNEFKFKLTPLSCKFLSTFMDGSLLTAVWLLVIMTLERVIVVWFPLRQKEWCTPTRALICCAVILFCCSGVVTHYWWTFTVYRNPSGNHWCNLRLKYYRWEGPWYLAYSVGYSIVPFLLLLGLNTALVMGMVKITRRRAKLQSNVDNTQLHRISVMAVTVSVTYILLTGPNTITGFIINMRWVNMFKTIRFFLDIYCMRHAFLMLMNLNHCVNLFLYFLSGKGFRQEFIDTLTCGRVKPTTEMKTSATKLSSKTDPSSQPSTGM